MGPGCSLQHDPAFVTPNSHRLARQSQVQTKIDPSPHVDINSFDSSHVLRWKDNFNSFNIPKKEYLSLLVNWA